MGSFWARTSLIVMTSFLSSAGGNCQDAVTLVEVFAIKEKLSGAFEGSTIKQEHVLLVQNCYF